MEIDWAYFQKACWIYREDHTQLEPWKDSKVRVSHNYLEGEYWEGSLKGQENMEQCEKTGHWQEPMEAFHWSPMIKEQQELKMTQKSTCERVYFFPSTWIIKCLKNQQCSGMSFLIPREIFYKNQVNLNFKLFNFYI